MCFGQRIYCAVGGEVGWDHKAMCSTHLSMLAVCFEQLM